MATSAHAPTFSQRSAFWTFWSSSMKLSTVGTEIKFHKTCRLTHVSNLWSSNLSAHSILNCFLTKCLYYPCLIISYGPTSPLSILHQRVFGITFPTNLSSCKISFYSQKETKNKCNFHSVSVGVINCLLGTSRKLFFPLCRLFWKKKNWRCWDDNNVKKQKEERSREENDRRTLQLMDKHRDTKSNIEGSVIGSYPGNWMPIKWWDLNTWRRTSL